MSSTDVAVRAGSLAAPPAIDGVDARRLDLIKRKVSSGKRAVEPTMAELATFLELCGKYELDPFANEVWLAKSEGRDGGPGQILIMVGRDGLRRIARRNGLDIDSDVVHEGDSFAVERVLLNGKRTRTVTHSYGLPKDRGAIVGAWCEVWRKADGVQVGYYYAPLSEYMPTNEKKKQYSPWGSQPSVMIMTAAERNALRQATPLGGVLGEGEDARIGEANAVDQVLADAEALTAFIMELDAPLELREELASAIGALNVLEPNTWGLGRAQMSLPGRDPQELEEELEFVQQEVLAAQERANARAAVQVREAAATAAGTVAPAEPEEHITDAEVVDDAPAAPAVGPDACVMCDRPLGEHTDADLAECHTAADQEGDQ